MHVALSYNRLNQLREDKYHSAKAAGYRLASYVCSRSVVWPDLSVGDNCFILENQTIQPTVKIGNNVMIWSGNHLGHGTQIKDHVYIASHVCIAGHCVIGERSFMGVNATTADFTTNPPAVITSAAARAAFEIFTIPESLLIGGVARSSGRPAVVQAGPCLAGGARHAAVNDV